MLFRSEEWSQTAVHRSEDREDLRELIVMITVTIYKKSNQYLGFDINGHAGYAEEGSDIICAAVSVLSLNTLNSIEAFTEDEFSGEQGDGSLTCTFPEPLSEKAALLMDSMVLGLTDIQKSYGKPYIRIVFKEV